MSAPPGQTRPRKPTALKIVEGTLDKSGTKNKQEPQYEVKFPEPPDYLSPHQKWAWRRFAEVLSPMRVVTIADFAIMEQLACTYSEQVLMRDQIRKRHRRIAKMSESDQIISGEDHYTYESHDTKTGKLVRHQIPEVAMLNEVDRKLTGLLGRFGLTPADRSRVSVSDAVQDDPQNEFSQD